jgi:amidase
VDRTDLAFAGAARQAELVRAGEVSSRELVELYLERIERLDPELNAYRVVMAERALAEADQADGRRSAGDERPLLGVPVAVKDNVDVAGEVTTHGTGCFSEPAASDAEVVRRLRQAGAVIIGKTNLPELAIIGATESPTWGVTRNPWDPERTTGGSSGGSAAAVAAGLAAAAHASDGAGSIRIPAANCGLVGLKPQRGRVSLMPEPEHWHGLSVAGSVTRTVMDTAVFLDAVAGPAPGDAHTVPAPEAPFAELAARQPGRLRIGLSYRGSLPVALDGEIRGAVDDLAGALRGLGHEVSPIEPTLDQIGANQIPRYLKGIQDDGERMPRRDRLSRRTRGFIALGRAIPRGALAMALRDEPRQSARVNRVFEHCDVLLTPATARPPVRAAEWEGMPATRCLLSMARTYPYTAQWNATGNPCMAVPAGLSREGLPLGALLVGRPCDEGTLLALAAQLEGECGWAERRPPGL